MARKAIATKGKLEGPESLPIKEGYIKTFPMVVTVYDLKTDEIVREEHIDYSNLDHRKWLGRLTYYCCTNELSVETVSLKDHEKFK